MWGECTINHYLSIAYCIKFSLPELYPKISLSPCSWSYFFRNLIPNYYLNTLNQFAGCIYPESERWPEALKAQKSHDQFMDYIGLNPKNEY